MKKTVFALSALAVLNGGADCTYSTSGGNLADPTKWDPSMPGESDIGLIDKGGTYTLSSDIAFLQLKVSTTAQCDFDFTDGNHTMSLSQNNLPFYIYDGTKSRNVHLKGGTWNFGGKKFYGMGSGSWLYLEDGVIVTNVDAFYGCYFAAKNSCLRMNDASAIYCNSFTLAGNGKDVTGAQLYVQGGSKIVDWGSFISDSSQTAGLKSHNMIIVSGTGSEITSGLVELGTKASCNSIEINNGGVLRSSGPFKLGNTSSSTNIITMSGGALHTSGEFLVRPDSCDNVFAATNSTLSFGSITNQGLRTTFDFQDCTFTVGDFRPFVLGGGRFRFGGRNSILTVTGITDNPFWTIAKTIASADNRFVVDDNAALQLSLGGTSRWMVNVSNSMVTVSNGAKLSTATGDSLFIGDERASLANCRNNAIVICSGGELTVGNSFRVYGTNNMVHVSDGTVAANNMIIGGMSQSNQPSHDCRVNISGIAPAIELEGAFWLHCDSVLRFELPALGYVDGFIPIRAGYFLFNPAARIEIDYSAYLGNGGGVVTLVSFTGTPSDQGGVSFAQWIENQNTLMNLPKGCKLRVEDDANGYRVVFRARNPSGFVISLK